MSRKVSGREVWNWPEFQAFAKRLGIPMQNVLGVVIDISMTNATYTVTRRAIDASPSGMEIPDGWNAEPTDKINARGDDLFQLTVDGYVSEVTMAELETMVMNWHGQQTPASEIQEVG